MTMRIPLFFSLLLAIPSFSAEKGVEGVVTATRLNVRVRPGTKYTRVAQLKKDDKVTVLRYKDGWYEILAPADAKVWISSLFIENGRVTKRANLRSGSSVANSSYRMAEPGEILTVLGTSSGWTKVKPPKNLSAWVSAKFIYLTPDAAAKLAKKPSVAEKVAAKRKKEKNKSESATKKVNVQAQQLPFLDSKGKIVTHDGVLLTLSKNAPYVTHAVAAKSNGEYFPFCYVHSDTCNLKLWENRRVRVTGEQRWVKGWQRPVVNVTKIVPAH
jgi:uncharacterized protein YgiM (DUF1202 family)